MRPFQFDSSFRTMRGVFYPTGWTVLMFPTEQAARDAGGKLQQAGVAERDVMLMTPQDFRTHIQGAAGDDDMLPSAGSEGDTVRRLAELAAQGHYGLMVHTPKGEDSDRLTQALKDCPMVYGQKYRTLVIEDVET